MAGVIGQTDSEAIPPLERTEEVALHWALLLLAYDFGA